MAYVAYPISGNFSSITLDAGGCVDFGGNFQLCDSGVLGNLKLTDGVRTFYMDIASQASYIRWPSTAGGTSYLNHRMGIVSVNECRVSSSGFLGRAAKWEFASISGDTTGMVRLTDGAGTPNGIQLDFSTDGTLDLKNAGGTAGATVSYRRSVAVPVSQSITAVTDTIQGDAEALNISANGVYTMTSTPTVALGEEGQQVRIVNTGANTVTLQDEGNLAGTLLNLQGGADIALSTDSMLVIEQRGSKYVEVSRSIN